MSAVSELVNQYGLLAIFMVITLEYACFPLPSEVVLPLSGALAARGDIGLMTIYSISIVAGLLGSSACYFVGRWGGTPLLNRFMARFPKSQSSLMASQNTFNHYAHIAVCVGRMVPLCRTYISFIAGAAHQRYGSFLFFSALGIACWNAVLLSMGYFLGEKWSLVLRYYHEFKVILIPLALVVIVFLALIRFMKKRHTV